MFIVGIDIAKRSYVARIIDSEGRTVVKPFSIRNNCSGYNALLARMNKITNRKSEFVLAMEATSHYWLLSFRTLCSVLVLGILPNANAPKFSLMARERAAGRLDFLPASQPFFCADFEISELKLSSATMAHKSSNTAFRLLGGVWILPNP